MSDSIINDTLISFLETPLYSGDDIFERFKALPNAVYAEGEKPLERYLYIKGKSKNRVLLMAHTDTVWDKSYIKKEIPHELLIDGDTVTNKNGLAGIGADDRAGCALLWLLKDSGHSILLLDGEEHGHFGALFLQKNKKLMRELNNHLYALQLDLWGKDECKYHGIKNPKAFCDFIESNGFVNRPIKTGGTDVVYICRKIAGVNVSVGYENFHKKTEQISLKDFENSCNLIKGLLEKSNKNYRTPVFYRMYRDLRHISALVLKPVFRFIKNTVLKKR